MKTFSHYTWHCIHGTVGCDHTHVPVYMPFVIPICLPCPDRQCLRRLVGSIVPRRNSPPMLLPQPQTHLVQQSLIRLLLISLTRCPYLDSKVLFRLHQFSTTCPPTPANPQTDPARADVKRQSTWQTFEAFVHDSSISLLKSVLQSTRTFSAEPNL